MEASSGSAPPLPVDERLVARLWDDQHPFAFPLKASSGEEIRVVYRGRRRYDRGPDFPGALIAIEGRDLRLGDVEIHVRSSDWRRHGHHRDPHYNGVILHVVLWIDATEPCTRQDGVPVPVVALAAHLSRPLESLLSQVAGDAPRPSPCWRGSMDRDGELGTVLERCGMERFEARVRRYEADLTCCAPDQLLYQGIATALGYSQNREPFDRLAKLLPLEAALAVRTTGGSEAHLIEALLLGTAGLLPSQRGMPGEGDEYAQALEEQWAAEGTSWAGASMQPAEWQFFRVRPNNFPTRRLAALAHLLSRWPAEGLAQTLANLAVTLEPKRLPGALEVPLLGAPREGYWRVHCDFGLPLHRPADLVGRQRAAEVAVNVFLPFLGAWANARSEVELGRRVREAYRVYPKRGDNEIARYAAVQVTGAARPPVARSACRQQGLLHIYRTWCEVKRCAECPCGS